MVAGHLSEKSGYYYAVLSYTDSLGKKENQVAQNRSSRKGKQEESRSIPCGCQTQLCSRRAKNYEWRHIVRRFHRTVA